MPVVRHVRKNRLYMGAPDSALSPLDDRTESGTVVGAFRSQAVANNSVPGTMDCTYDKTTYRPRVCVISVQGLSTPVRVTYDSWDDPANAVEPPAGVPAPTPVPSRPPAAPAPAPTRPGAPGPGAPH